MQVFYQGVDVTGMVETRKCIVRDASGERCDSLELEFENAAGWYSWGPAEGDQIIVTQGGYDSGVMYLNTVVPAEGRYRLFATSLPCAARVTGNRSYSKMTVAQIIEQCAMESGMGFQVFGGIGGVYVPYIERNAEMCAAFLHKLLTLESAVLKCVNGRYTAIGLEYAQNRTARQAFAVYANQRTAEYMRNGMRLRGLTVSSPYASATAEDRLAAVTGKRVTIDGLPVMDAAQAGRWARGKLMYMNRQTESVRIQMEFNPGLTAMERVDITGDTDAVGYWLVEDVEHDLVNLTSAATLRRVIQSIR